MELPKSPDVPVDPSAYTAKYYQSSNYADYLERTDRYKKTAYEVADLLRKLNLVQKESNIIDYGCAVGFLLEGFQELGFKNTIGYEVSEWAIQNGRERGNNIYYWSPYNFVPFTAHVMTALDVFEHMTDGQISEVITTLNPKCMVVRIPSSVDGGKTFALEISRQDPTHINCKTKEQWIEFFRGFGYKTFLRLNLFTVYDTPGVTCLLIL